MADQPTTPSGSRWEPEPDDTAVQSPVAEAPGTAASDVAGTAPAAPPDDPVAEARRAHVRGRAILAGAATALTLGGGLTGFVIGHSTAGTQNDFRQANFSGQMPGSGQLGEGQAGMGQQGTGQQGSGQQSGGQQGDGGPPAFGGGNGGGQLGQQAPGTSGSSSSGSGSSGSGTTGTGT